jgi:hypothetical protein
MLFFLSFFPLQSTCPYLGEAGGSDGEDLPDPDPISDLLNSSLANESIFWATRGARSEISSKITQKFQFLSLLQYDLLKFYVKYFKFVILEKISFKFYLNC